MNVIEQMSKFIEPGSVALLGVSRQTGENARNILENLLNWGYGGKLYPVNPNASEILGVKTYQRVGDIPDDNIDLAIINLPRPLVVGTVQECVDKGIRAVIIVTQGFADSNDEEGHRLQKELDELVRNSGTRIIGPNTYGTANGFINYSSAFTRMELMPVPVGIICQTGGFFNGIPGLQCAGKGFDLGNGSDVDFADCMEYFEQDDDVKVVILHIEGIRDGKRFITAANRLARKKPVIALKTGRSQSSASAIQSHTGSLAGSDTVWDAALAQAGVIRVDDLDEIVDLTKAFTSLPLLKGKRIGIATNSGGIGIMCVDACYRYNLEPATLSPASVERLTPLYPPWLKVKNPLDTVAAALVQKQSFGTVLRESVGTFLSDEGVDALLYISVASSGERISGMADVLVELAGAYPDKPLVCSFQGKYAGETKKELEKSGKTVVYDDPTRAVRALARSFQYYSFRQTH